MSAKKKVAVDKTLRHLSDLVSAAGIRLKTKSALSSPPSTRGEVQASAGRLGPLPVSDEDLFLFAMNDVDRASWRRNPHPSPLPPPDVPQDSDLEEFKLMQTAFDDGDIEPVLNHPEYIEGWIGVAGKKFLPMLRNGLYSIQEQIDLHGLNRIEAQIAVAEFIARMSRFQSCCIKIIHGRGINSPTDKATLKEDLQRLLKTRKMARHIVAYASASACDGGVGAVYVLLRRQ